MPRLDRLPQANRNNLVNMPVQTHETSPFVQLRKPLAECRLAIVTTAGLHRRGDRPFGPADQTYRVIPSDTPSADIIQSHTSIGFDRVADHARHQHLVSDRPCPRARRSRGARRAGSEKLLVHGRAA